MTKLFKPGTCETPVFIKNGKKKEDPYFNRVSRPAAKANWVKDGLEQAEIYGVDQAKDDLCHRSKKR